MKQKEQLLNFVGFKKKENKYIYGISVNCSVVDKLIKKQNLLQTGETMRNLLKVVKKEFLKQLRLRLKFIKIDQEK